MKMVKCLPEFKYFYCILEKSLSVIVALMKRVFLILKCNRCTNGTRDYIK